MLFTKKTLLLTTGLMLVLGGGVPSAATAALTVPVAIRFADDATAEDSSARVQEATTSELASIALPAGAQRATGADDLAKFHSALQEAARSSQGTVTRSEVLVWTGDITKTVVGDVSSRLKEAGYTVTLTPSFDAEPGKVTPIAALRGDTSNGLIGMWIETSDGCSLLVWGQFHRDSTTAPVKVALAKTASTASTASTPKKAPAKAAPVKKTAAAPKKKLVVAKAKKKSSYSSSGSAAERQAKAFKAYKDYQYVKMMGPISGPMYRSTKW